MSLFDRLNTLCCSVDNQETSWAPSPSQAGYYMCFWTPVQGGCMASGEAVSRVSVPTTSSRVSPIPENRPRTKQHFAPSQMRTFSKRVRNSLPNSCASWCWEKDNFKIYRRTHEIIQYKRRLCEITCHLTRMNLEHLDLSLPWLTRRRQPFSLETAAAPQRPFAML